MWVKGFSRAAAVGWRALCLSRVSLQCCSGSPAEEHLEVCPEAVWVSPAGPEHPPALPWLWVLPKRHQLGTCYRQAASPNPPTVLSLMERDLSREGEGSCIL